MNNIDEITCSNCLNIFTLPVKGVQENGKFTCSDCVKKILSELSAIKRKMGFKRYDE